VFADLYPALRPVGEVLELVDLVDDAEARVGAISGRQPRRVDVAIGTIGRPDVLFLDEPTTGLDPEARRRAWTAVETLATTGTTVVLTTHFIDEAGTSLTDWSRSRPGRSWPTPPPKGRAPRAVHP